jgi:hypothetical protein
MITRILRKDIFSLPLLNTIIRVERHINATIADNKVKSIGKSR